MCYPPAWYNKSIKGGTMMSVTPMISQQERARREAAIRFARNSVRLEGFKLSVDAEALFTLYINGDLTRSQLNEAVRQLAYGQSHR